ncbi:hypothetical protein EB796_024451 [Bugula neritina]|uniref:Uncharacterized protein n=1 Tax=Bugula neritina TaxID=10212 RepID=A0A7J7ITI6_BUGNE|nr:hypothetical protein EB796_024451 [Bugula neritina]
MLIFSQWVYLLIWFWLFLVSVMTFIGIILWIKLHCFQLSFVKKCLRHNVHDVSEKYGWLLKEFNDDYLSYDGVFLLKMVYMNSRCSEFDELIAGLWNCFVKNKFSQAESTFHCVQSVDSAQVDGRCKANPAENVDSEGDCPDVGCFTT